LKKLYISEPLIIFEAKEQHEALIDLLIKNSFKKYVLGNEEDSLILIRGWSEGILILDPDVSYGLDARF
jgi:hypothetical protein